MNCNSAIVDSATFAKAYEAGLPRTIGFLFSRGFHGDFVPDLAQAAWSRAWERIEQLRDESRIVSWVNTIALHEARLELRHARRRVPLHQSHEGTTTLNLAAIDLAKIIELCEPDDREMLLAQLEGTSSIELAEGNGVSSRAMRLRCFRARRAARERCEQVLLAKNLSLPEEIAELQGEFYASCMDVARTQVEASAMFLRMAEVAREELSRLRLLDLVNKGISSALSSLKAIKDPNVDVTPLVSAAKELSCKMSQLAEQSCR